MADATLNNARKSTITRLGTNATRQAAQIIVKGFLCFLIIAPPLLFGQELTSSRPAFPDSPYEPSGGSATVGGVAEPARATVSV